MTQDRLAWVDLTKGVAIVLVVLGHCWRGLNAANLIDNPRLFQIVDTAIYLFHMPLFFMMSGMFFASVAARPFLKVLQSRAILLLYPMTIWTILMSAGKLSMGKLANAPLTWDSFVWFPLPPVWQFWFLWALFVIQIALALATRFSASFRPVGALHWWILFAVSIMLLPLISELGALSKYLKFAINYAPFFILGILLNHYKFFPRVMPLWPVAVIVACEAVVLTGWMPLSLKPVVSAIICLAVILLCRWIADAPSAQRVTRVLGGLGIVSMAIYLAHTFFSAPLRAVLIKLDITSLPVHTLLGTAIGILGPLVVLDLSKRLKFRRLIGF